MTKTRWLRTGAIALILWSAQVPWPAQGFAQQDDLVAMTHNMDGLTARLNGDYAEAEKQYKLAIGFAKKDSGAEKEILALTLVSLATLYLDKERYAEAEPLGKSALAIQKKLHSPDNKTLLAQILTNLANGYGAQHKRYVEADSFYKRALKAWEKNLDVKDKTEFFLARFNFVETAKKYTTLLREAGHGGEADRVMAHQKKLLAKYGK